MLNLMKDTNYTVVDIETGILPDAQRNLFRPEFEANRTLKDPEKIKADLATKETRFQEEAALSALTGRILCVGCWTDRKGVFVIESEDESDVITATMDLLQSTIQAGDRVVGHYLKQFDLPFLCQRAWRLGVYVPQCLRRSKWWADEIVDLAEIWNTGTTNRISLDHLSKALGVGAKNGEGKDFGKMWNENKPAALEYCRQDVFLIKGCAEKMLPH